LAADNRQLRSQLQELLKQAHNNQRIMQRYHSLNLKLIGSNSLAELLDAIFGDLQTSSSLDMVTLMVLDTEYELRRVLTSLNIDLALFPNFLLRKSLANLPADFFALRKPELRAFSTKRHSLFFPNGSQPASVAIMPLYRKQQLIGYLNFGSRDPHRFVGDVATDFIEEQAAIIAICLENVVNQERLKHFGLTDPLTGIHNRRYLESRLQEEIRRTQRQQSPLSCLYIDIDHFKQINDRFGHQHGDDILREVAARIKSELRLSDAFGRFGGEEFIVLLIDTPPTGAQNVAERIRDGIANKSFSLGTGQTCSVTVSIGVATLTTPQQSQTLGVIAQDFIGRADLALYRAKNDGRNRIVSID